MILLGTGILFCGIVCLLIPIQNEILSLIGLIIIGFGWRAHISLHNSFDAL